MWQHWKIGMCERQTELSDARSSDEEVARIELWWGRSRRGEEGEQCGCDAQRTKRYVRYVILRYVHVERARGGDRFGNGIKRLLGRVASAARSVTSPRKGESRRSLAALTRSAYVYINCDNTRVFFLLILLFLSYEAVFLVVFLFVFLTDTCWYISRSIIHSFPPRSLSFIVFVLFFYMTRCSSGFRTSSLTVIHAAVYFALPSR